LARAPGIESGAASVQSVNGNAARTGFDLDWNSAASDFAVYLSAVDRALNANRVVQVDGS